MTLIEAVGKRVADLLQKDNLPQYYLQREGGIPRSTVSLLVAGKHKSVKLDTIFEISATLGITLKEFFDDPMFNDISD